jgi:hypothetical protein
MRTLDTALHVRYFLRPWAAHHYEIAGPRPGCELSVQQSSFW